MILFLSPFLYLDDNDNLFKGLDKDNEEEGLEDDTLEETLDPWGVINKPLRIINLR